MPIELLDREERWLAGDDGTAMQFAMRMVLAAAEVSGASALVPVEMAHINSCHWSGPMSLDFAEFLIAEGATLAVPTHTNASLISCSSPHLRPEADDPVAVRGAERMMEIYEQLGCSSIWTCAPYQQPEARPVFGQQIVGSESNAVGFFNSVIGARTNKYGDLIDVSAAMVGRVPLAGLHTDEGRRGTHVFDITKLDSAAMADPNLSHLLGVLIGRDVGTGIAVIAGLDSASEDDLKAIASGAAASGGVDLFHVVGITPEAPTVEAALHGQPAETQFEVTGAALDAVKATLTTAARDEPLRAVCLGTPHFSVTEFIATADLLRDRRVAAGVTVLITTSRAVATEIELRGIADVLRGAGVEIILDTCTYYPPRATGLDGLTMTNSAKWAFYARGMLDVPIAFASLEQCVESAVAGRRL